LISLAWLTLAGSVLVASFGAGWWVSLAAVAMAWAASRFRTTGFALSSAAASILIGLYWLAIIPFTTGSELVLVLLAVESGAIVMASWRRIADLRRPAVIA
jgi:hypothetical protein